MKASKRPSLNPNRRLQILAGAHLVWLALVCLLGAWWGRLVLLQAKRIAELETSLGMAAQVTQTHWDRTQRMLYWESMTFFGLLLASTVLLGWLYWRDLLRARGLHAFFASVTHELRTPLTSIRLQAESIAENLTEETSQKKLVQRLLEDTLRLEAQVERTLELARVEGGGPVYSQPVQIKPWLDRFLKTWGADYSAKVEFVNRVEDVWIEADSSALQVIFKNLFENSIRHSKKEKVSIQISSKLEQDQVKLQLKDDGQGFQGDPRTLGLLFQKGPLSQGTGVGLYLVKTLMKRMGGWADFVNHPSGFEVLLFFPEGRQNG
jgi:signal transduction histidine kinase